MRILIVLITFLAAATPAFAKKIALVIGNDTYESLTLLERAREDAAGYRDWLQDEGFEFVALPGRDGPTDDLDRDAMVDALAVLYDSIEPGDVVVFVYSGHGWSDLQTGRNYLVPTDTPRVASQTQLAGRTIPLRNGANGVLDEIARRGARLTVAIIDACRDNPFQPPEGRRSSILMKGLARMDNLPSGTFVAMSARPGQAALDRLGSDDTARYSVFTRYLLPELRKGRELVTAMNAIELAVSDAARTVGHTQQPSQTDEVLGPVCLRDNCSVDTSPTVNTALEDWLLVKDSRSIAVLKAFIAKHPGTLYAGLAEERIEDIRKPVIPEEPETAGPPPPAPITEVEIAEAQRALNRLGFDAGIVDGIPGRKTRTAILGYQQREGLPGTGLPDWPTIEALRASLESLPPDPHPDLSTFRDCPECPEMVVIPSGDFRMGSPDSEEGRYDDEGPQRRVTVEKFALARTEVTFNQWAACVADGGCRSNLRPDDEGWGKGDRPVINVSWDDAQEYVAWLNTKVSGSPYRLPSEAEWEYAARANSTTAYPWGPRISHANANYDGIEGPDRWRYTAPVAQFPANGFTLHDMIGNVWEWVEDCGHGSYRNAPVTAVPWLQANGGDCSSRVRRGGSWLNTPRGLRSAFRVRGVPEDRVNIIGFRPARTLVTP